MSKKRHEKLARREQRRRQEDALNDRIDEALDDFATQMGCEPPSLVGHCPHPSAAVAQCHANVLQMVHFNGGRAVWGWHFSLNACDPDDLHIDAVFHAVWESPEGVFIDVTPQSDRVVAGQKAGLFTPLPFFCEDKRYFKECEVQDVGNGGLGFQTVRQTFPTREHETIKLGISMSL